MNRLLVSLLGAALAVGTSGCWLLEPVEGGGDTFRLPGGHSPDQAQAILTQAAAMYASVASYEDTGTIQEVVTRADGDRVNAPSTFDTVFARPDRFRFSYNEDGAPSKSYIIAMDGDRPQTWWYHLGSRSPTDLDLAVWGALGVSDRSSYLIPRQLMPEAISGISLTDISSAEILGEEEFDGVACTKIQLKSVHPEADWETLWIEKERLLIRKRVDHVKFHTFSIATTLTYEPQINIAIDPARFSLNPPVPDR